MLDWIKPNVFSKIEIKNRVVCFQNVGELLHSFFFNDVVSEIKRL